MLSGSPPDELRYSHGHDNLISVTAELLCTVSEKKDSLGFPCQRKPCTRATHMALPNTSHVQGNLPSGEQWVNCPANHSISLISPCRGVLFVLPGSYILYPAFLVIYLRGSFLILLSGIYFKFGLLFFFFLIANIESAKLFLLGILLIQKVYSQ